jgi:hypothetical protein
MAFDFEALVGHLYVVGGRSISTVPSGALVEVAPRRVARGREADTFFTLVLTSGDTPAPAAFYEQMARLGAERYFGSTGSVTSGLRDVFTTLNQDLVEHNESSRRKYEANMLCAVLRGDDLILGKVGSGMALYRHFGDTLAFPANFSSDEVLFGPPLGVQPIPDVKMSSYKVAHGTRLIMADEHLAELDLARMTTALGAVDIGAVLTDFKDLVTTRVTLMAVEFVPADAPSPLPVQVAESTTKVTPPKRSTQEVAVTGDISEFPEPNVGERLGDAAEGVEIRARRGVGGLALGLARGVGSVNKVFDRIMPQPAEGQRSWLATTKATGIAVLLPIVIVLVVLFLWLTSAGETAFELCVEQAMNTADLARSINPDDINGVLAAWGAVLVQVNGCDELRSGDSSVGDPTLVNLTREGQDIIDRLSSVERREAAALESFPNATLTQVILQGLDLYVLDDQNKLVYRVTLNNDGRGIVTNSRVPIPGMRLGAAVSEFTVGDIIDIAWSEEGNSLLALDNTGVLIACSPQFLQRCDAQRVQGSETWVGPVSITIWQERIYVLDPGANQVWRYEPSGGTYPNAPTEYFSGEGRPDIRAVVDFAIDANGAVYILFSQGTISKFISGELQPFGFSDFPEGQPLTSADALYLNRNPVAQNLYIVDRAHRTIYETTHAGTFMNSYRAYDENQFAALTNVIEDTSQQMIYALSGNSIFALERAGS